jgi:hypothetical protein
MAKKPAPKTQETKSFAYSLNDVIQATKENSFVYTEVDFHGPLVASGDVEVNPEMTNDKGEFATRATAKHLTQESPAMTESTVTAEKPKFEIEAGVPMPAVTRKVSTGLRAGRTPVYPFEQLEIDQSFFVPDANGKSAHKAMASTVNGANTRYVEEIPGEVRTNRKGNTVAATRQLRKFKSFDTYRTMEDGSIQKGARIFRVALDA